MRELDIRTITALEDNYVHLLRDPASGACAAVDPSEPAPVLAALAAWGWTLSMILCTHHHRDHVGGVPALKAATGCVVVGAARDRHRIPGIDRAVGEGDTVTLGAHASLVIEAPGHTSGHLLYHFAADGALFCGDTLFSLGCGRLFEGTATQMWDAMLRLRAMPDATRVYCGHEYTIENADFALTLEPDNPALKARAEEARRLARDGAFATPAPLGVEKAANPFLRADVPAVMTAVGMAGRPPVEVFAEIRARRDEF